MALYVNGKKVFNSLVVDGDIDNLIPISWSNETHNVQQNRTITVDGYNLNAPISQQSYSVGILSMPVTMPEGADGLLFCYDLVGASYTDGNYYATIFCSDSQITNITDKTSSYGNKILVQQSLSSGESVTGLIECLNIPSSSFYFNIQFGVSNFENLRLYAIRNGNVSGGGSSIPTLALYSGKINLSNGQTSADSDYYYSDFFDAPNGSLMVDLGETNSGTYVGLEMCTANGSHYDYYSASSRYRVVDHSSRYASAPKMRISFKASMLNAIIVKNLVDGTAYSIGVVKLDAGNS